MVCILKIHFTSTHINAHTFVRTNTPHLPTHALNLISHMKLYIIGLIKKRQIEERKKKGRKEQESVEAFQWTRNVIGMSDLNVMFKGLES